MLGAFGVEAMALWTALQSPQSSGDDVSKQPAPTRAESKQPEPSHRVVDERRWLTPEEHAQLTRLSTPVDAEGYGRAVAATNQALAADKVALFAGRAPGVDIKPLPDMGQMDALRFAVEAQTAWLERLERRLTALEAWRGA